MEKPYIDQKIDTNIFIRTFTTDIDESLLEWHWDEQHRTVEPLNDNDWQFQFDNELPFTITKEINIPAGVYHRVIKGTGPLIIKITEHEIL